MGANENRWQLISAVLPFVMQSGEGSWQQFAQL